MEQREWLDRFADALGVPAPGDDLIDGVLRLAAEAAHASVRQNAPIACWMAAAAGLDVGEALRRAREIPPAAS